MLIGGQNLFRGTLGVTKYGGTLVELVQKRWADKTNFSRASVWPPYSPPIGLVYSTGKSNPNFSVLIGWHLCKVALFAQLVTTILYYLKNSYHFLNNFIRCLKRSNLHTNYTLKPTSFNAKNKDDRTALRHT